MNIKSFAKIDLNQKPNRRERTIFILLLAALCLGFVRSCLLASHHAISSIRQQLESTSEERRQLIAAPNTAEASPAMQSDLVEKATINSKRFGSRQDVVDAVHFLTQPLQLRGVKIIKSKFADLREEGSLIYREADLTLSGSFAAIGAYIETLEALPAPLIIETLSINSDPSSRITAEIQGRFYGQQ